MGVETLTVISNRSSGVNKGYTSSPIGIVRLLIIISQICVGISFAFIVRPNFSQYWKSIPGSYIFYIVIALIVLVGSIIFYLLHLLVAFEGIIFEWRITMIVFDAIFSILSLIDGIAFTVLASSYSLDPVFNSPAFTAAAIFSFITFVLCILDIILWTRSVIRLS